MIRDFSIGVFGQAGHGKTALANALTGVDTDRSAACRGGSIDIGFAPLYLPSGPRVWIVDLPGREGFVKHMMAGATGIDFAVFVAAADEDVAAAVVEHAAIAELLGIGAAAVALSKVDLVDAGRTAEKEGRIAELLSGGGFRGAPVVRVSAVTKEGLSDLLSEIEAAAGGIAERMLDFPARLPIDSSVALSETRHLVNGPLWSGVLTADTELELLSTGEICRLRGVKVHGHSVGKALPGQRVEVDLVVCGRPPARGDFLAPPATFPPAAELIAKIRILPQAAGVFTGSGQLTLYHATGANRVRVEPLNEEKIRPGREAFVRILPDHPVPAVFRDRFVLRSLSPSLTVAGGIVLEARVRADRGAIEPARLSALAGRDNTGPVRELFRGRFSPLTPEDVAHTGQIGEEAAKQALDALAAAGGLTAVEAWRRVFFLDTGGLAQAHKELQKLLAKYHAEYPLQYGPTKKSVREGLWPYLSSSQADIVLDHFIKTGSIDSEDDRLSAGGPLQGQLAELCRLLGGFTPPNRRELAEAAGLTELATNRLLNRLEIGGHVSAVGPDIYFTSEALDETRDILTGYLLEAGEITVAGFQELLGMNREYAVALLRYFDRQNLTRRLGEVRFLSGS